VFFKHLGGMDHFVNKSRLAVVNVGDNGDVAYIFHEFARWACAFLKRATKVRFFKQGKKT
jgi:hypothetical protein